ANERKLLTAVGIHGPSTKRDICRKTSIAWATAVKLVRRLESEGFLRHVDVIERPRVQGPDSTVFDLAPDYPLAVGIDVEYANTRAVVTDLRGGVRASVRTPTPSFADAEAIARHVALAADEVVDRASADPERIVGTGVGLPRFLVQDEPRLFEVVAAAMTRDRSDRVVVDDVARAYALAMEFDRRSHRSFAAITIRSGVGLGLSVDGRLFRGDSNHAGLLGHLVVRPGVSGRCPHCGRSGCLEQFVNDTLVTADLLAAASAGQPDAVAELADRADALAHALSFLVMVTNIEEIFVAAHFGPHGDLFADSVRSALSRYAPPFVPHRIEMIPLCDDRFALGAGFFVLRDYFNYELV
ncbi:MAG: ROK family protein, partial [Spirochaetaceae bacterium]